MKAYKGFNKDMTCRDFQYEEGKEYEHKGGIDVCSSGFHACERPIDVFAYYPPGTSVYHEVEQSGDMKKGDDKTCSTKIRIGAKIDIIGMVNATVEYVKSKCTNANNAKAREPATAGFRGAATAGSYGAATAGFRGAATAGSYGAATAGDSGAATAGFRGAATAGDSGAATAGFRGAATAGSYGAATAGDSGAATAGDSGAATAGFRGAATAGSYGAATAGSYGAATSRGKSSSGKNGLSVARGNNVRVRGGIGAILVIVEENNVNYDIKDYKVVVVDGVTIKANTWYRLENGELIECGD